ncbi:phospholipase D-like domain-containing protein [Porticoccus sp.]|jgi:cardiolipin synthase|uniref:phospholipase D-like domain-containing protein n=1 Tax=Porticoccus sp. TaxID=2024853 RepID=UPI0039E3BCF4
MLMTAESKNESGMLAAECAGNDIRIFIEGDTLFDAMLSDFSSARRRVWLESYIFADDAIGREFLKVLTDCSRRGLDVRVRVDALGSKFGFSGGSAHCLKAAGVKFVWCHPWQWRKPWLFHRRNHRKLAVVDDQIAYLGGFNITALNSRRISGDARWRDTHFRLSGPLVDDARRAFESFARGDLKWQRGGNRDGMELLTNHGRACRFRLRCHLKDRFNAARKRLWLTTPYFVPDSGTQRDLCRAASKGVDVRVLVPGKSDVPFVQWAARAAYSTLLASGIRIFEYQPRVLHAKTLIVDDDWSTVGRANFDYRSLFINYELNLAAECHALNATLATIFESDLNESLEVRQRPCSRRLPSARVGDLIGWSERQWP